jgi:AraC family transcriptional regulator
MAANGEGARAGARSAPDLDVSIDWLYTGATVRITRYRCLAASRGLGSEQRQAAHVIGFPYEGVFELHQGRDQAVIEPGSVLFLNDGASYRTSHPCGGGDHGSAIAVRPDVLVEALARHDPSAADRPEAPFRFPAGASTPRTYLLQRLLFLRISRPGSPDALGVEEAALALVDDVAASACRSDESPSTRRPPGPGHRRIVDSARACLADRFAQPMGLEAIATAVGVSPFHLCRIFRAVTGMTVSRYRHRLRLRAALTRVAEAWADLSAIAFESGYSSHSHFTAAFRREFGMTPTQFRRATGRDRREAARIPGRARI